MSNPVSNIACLLQAYRETRGISLRTMADVIGINFAALHRFEKGEEVEARQVLSIVNWMMNGSNGKSPSDA